MLWRYALLIFGVFCGSTAVIAINLSGVHPTLLAGYRCLIAAIALGPLFVRDLRRYPEMRSELVRAALPGLLMGLHFVSWNFGARMTPVAHAILIVNMVPLVMPLFLYVLVRERLTRREVAGTAVALGGVVLLSARDLHLSLDHFRGDLVCLVSMLFFCVYLVFGRRNRDFPSVWLYLVPLYLVAGLVGLAAGVLWADPLRAYPLRDVLTVLWLALVPTVMGHSILNYSMRHMHGQRVGIANLGQIIFATAMGFLILGQVPAAMFYPAALLLAAGIALAFSRPARAETVE
jgi:drug/metabolite transporter (DMT)-like permease